MVPLSSWLFAFSNIVLKYLVGNDPHVGWGANHYVHKSQEASRDDKLEASMRLIVALDRGHGCSILVV